jgi:hypothetical protein
VLCHFRESFFQTTAYQPRVPQWSSNQQGTFPNSANATPQRLHTMKSITLFRRFPMSHEQNMHHHLIYLATTMFNTNETQSGCNLLISIQIISFLAIAASCISCPGQPPSTAWLLGGPLYLELTSQRTRLVLLQSRYVYNFPSPHPQPSVMSVSYFSSATQSVHVDNPYQAYLSDPENNNTSFTSICQL